MRSKSPELMSEIKKYIEDYYLQNRQSPSTTKIAEAVGIARGMLLSAVNNLKDSEYEELHLLMVDNHIPAGAKLY